MCKERGVCFDADSAPRYPDNNCAAVYTGFGPTKDPQTAFPEYLNHSNISSLTSQYAPSTFLAQSVGKPFQMFETNTASSGGFPGIIDSFGAALWATDSGFQMANFSEALLPLRSSPNCPVGVPQVDCLSDVLYFLDPCRGLREVGHISRHRSGCQQKEYPYPCLCHLAECCALRTRLVQLRHGSERHYRQQRCHLGWRWPNWAACRNPGDCQGEILTSC